MKNNRYLRNAIPALILILFIAVIPAAAELEPDFDWQVYRINTEDWTGYSDYIKYSGTIYKVHFTDETTGGAVAWDWEFSEDDWWGSSEQDPIHIYTQEEAEEDLYSFKVTLSASDSSGVPYEVSHTIYVEEDEWNLNPIYDLTPAPTTAPTPVPTTAIPTPTPVPTEPPTPTPVPTEPPVFSMNVPVISPEIIKLKAAFNDHLEVILQVFRNIGILSE
ncbi:MAG: PKD domain-containing protein [Methanomicrobiaceae archaeon]|nr:PKD domain-containing protein [Methanomicrobiaceae archaeon]